MDLTKGNINRLIIRFAIPFLLACFLQTFYGLADLFIVGLFCPASTGAAVSIGSQIMHMITVMTVGLTVGVTVGIGQSLGAKDKRRASSFACASLISFLVLSVAVMAVLLCLIPQINAVMMTPEEAVKELGDYLRICFLGMPFIVMCNVISGIFRGVGDSRSPMLFVAIACVVNIVLDLLFTGLMHMGATGAALGTVLGQGVSVFAGPIALAKKDTGLEIMSAFSGSFMSEMRDIFAVGLPVCIQEGLIQVAFILITVIANSRGLVDSVGVGVVEKLISFLFLVHSAFLSALSAFCAQNTGAGEYDRARKGMVFCMKVTLAWGLFCFLCCQLFPGQLVGLFRREEEIIAAGSIYLRSYSLDCIFAAVHFVFSGYFCGCGRSMISFIHNIISVVLVRVPGAWYASVSHPESLFFMGLAAPMGSLLSVFICLIFYLKLRGGQNRRPEMSGPDCD